MSGEFSKRCLFCELAITWLNLVEYHVVAEVAGKLRSGRIVSVIDVTFTSFGSNLPAMDAQTYHARVTS
jgi:hypothetical protein